MRKAGVLLHISSLPGPYGCGTFGKEAYRFADFLAESGFSIWQVLPFNPVDKANSPYCSASAFAGNILFINPKKLYVKKCKKQKNTLAIFCNEKHYHIVCIYVERKFYDKISTTFF